MSTKLITTGVQKILASYGNSELVFEIDFDHPEAKKTIKDMSMVWPFGPVKEAPFEEHLKFWLQRAIFESYQFFCEQLKPPHTYFLDADGFCDMDGSKGILIDHFYYYLPSHDDVEIKMY